MPLNGPRSLSNFTIGTFNVRDLSSETKRDQLSEYLNSLHIDVCCIQETQCPSGFDVISGYYRPLSRRLDRCDRVIQNESRDPFGGNVCYVTMQITFLTRKFRNEERNLHCDVVHITTKRVSSLTLDCNGVFAIKAYSLIGLPSTSRHYGLAFAVASYLADGLLRYWSVSDRLAVIQLTLGSHSTLTIINAYGPTSQVTLRNQDTQDDVYAALDFITTRYSSSALIQIAGDFNSKLGNKLPNELSIGEHSCGIRNTNGSVLARFLETHGLFACNTAFQHANLHVTRPRGKVNTEMRRTGLLYPSTTLSILSSVVNLTKAY